ncbi:MULTISPECIES: hypothetical protein [Salinibaculum]|uniref:hypothetical protein n=1 Tax=Salinibaculum TaxID=2732368 RepID=UPI0030CBBF59
MDDGGISRELQDRLEEHKSEQASQPGTLELSEGTGFVGDEVTLAGRDLPAGERLNVVWHTSTGRWGLVQANEVMDPVYEPRTETILSVDTDEDGAFDETWQVHEDYGGEHVVEVQTRGGTTLASSEYLVEPHFELDRTTAPLGEAFRLTAYGLGPDRVTNNYQVTWNNSYVGFLTGVLNRGTATAEIRAVGPPGEHAVQIWRSPEGMPYLQNYTQSPLGEMTDDRTTSWTVEVTEPDERPETAWMDPLLEEHPIEEHLVDPDEDTGASLSVSPTSGQSGTDAIVTGEGFPPNTEVDLVWHTHAGHRFMHDTVTAEPRLDVLPTVETDAAGSFQVDVTIPRDIGETRPIAAEVDGRSVATTAFVLQPEIVDISPTSGPVGTEIDVKVAGLGWARYENNYCVLYDNSLSGYVCSHNRTDSDEDGSLVHFRLKAGGQPGLHFIDLIPTFNDTRVEDFKLENRPHLSYIDNHPLRPLPGIHFAFEVTAE